MKYLKILGISAFVILGAGCGGSTVQNAKVDASSQEYQTQEYSEEPEDKGDNFVDLSAQEEPKAELLLRPVYFGFDQFFIRDDMKPIVQGNSAYIKDQAMHNTLKRILLEGNTDEFGSSEYNFALGLKRAIAVRDALVLQGVNKDVLDYISYGKTNPVCSEKTPECYANNRRVDVVQIDKDVKSGTMIDKNR